MKIADLKKLTPEEMRSAFADIINASDSARRAWERRKVKMTKESHGPFTDDQLLAYQEGRMTAFYDAVQIMTISAKQRWNTMTDRTRDTEKVDCPRCLGCGELDASAFPCPVCAGSGYVRKTKRRQVKAAKTPVDQTETP